VKFCGTEVAEGYIIKDGEQLTTYNKGEKVPPAAVKTVKDLMYWQYAKIISGSAGIGKKEYGFIMERFKKLQKGDIFWNEIREYVKEQERKGECIFCGKKEKLTMDHMFPSSLGGPDDEKNVAWVCKSCNSSKGKRRLYEFWTMTKGLKSAKYDIPRIAEGKYLKLLYEAMRNAGMLGLDIEKIRLDVCPDCDLKDLCKKEDSEGKLSPLCLDGVATLCFRQK
jgi:hypothetical protein